MLEFYVNYSINSGATQKRVQVGPFNNVALATSPIISAELVQTALGGGQTRLQLRASQVMTAKAPQRPVSLLAKARPARTPARMN